MYNGWIPGHTGIQGFATVHRPGRKRRKRVPRPDFNRGNAYEVIRGGTSCAHDEQKASQSPSTSTGIGPSTTGTN